MATFVIGLFSGPTVGNYLETMVRVFRYSGQNREL